MNDLIPVEPEYVYVTIPAEYICVYHRILAMMADYGEEMLKDCKASCTDKNSGVIECFNMFNSAVAARKLGKDKLASVIITYVKAKINQIYKGFDNSTSFVFPIDENGEIKAFVSCGERPIFEINSDDGMLYEHKFNNGFDEHFKLSPEDYGENDETSTPVDDTGLKVILTPMWEKIDGKVHPCADIVAYFDKKLIDLNTAICQYYFDGKLVKRFNDVTNLSTGEHNFKVVVKYNGHVNVESANLEYENTD